MSSDEIAPSAALSSQPTGREPDPVRRSTAREERSARERLVFEQSRARLVVAALGCTAAAVVFYSLRDAYSSEPTLRGVVFTTVFVGGAVTCGFAVVLLVWFILRPAKVILDSVGIEVRHLFVGGRLDWDEVAQVTVEGMFGVTMPVLIAARGKPLKLPGGMALTPEELAWIVDDYRRGAAGR